MSNEVLAFCTRAGQNKSKTASAIAGNVVTKIACTSTGQHLRWFLDWLKIYLDTDGNAGNRYIQLQILNESDTVILDIGMTTVITQNQTGILMIAPFGVPVNATLGTTGVDVSSAIPIAYPFRINQGDKIAITISGGLAGDSYSYYGQLLEVALYE
jgi:hypothetical protein